MSHIKEVTSIEDFHSLLEKSKSAPVLLLKHSTTCPISARAHGEYERFISQNTNESVECHLVKVIESRPVSLAIADETGVKHESPQLLLLKDGKVQSVDNHFDISASKITKNLG